MLLLLANDVKTLELKNTFRAKDSEFFTPAYIMSTEAGEDLVSDEINHSICVLDSELCFKRRVGRFGHEPGEFWYPGGMAMGGDELFVADRWNHRIQVFDPDLQFKRSIGSYGHALGELNEPVGIAWSEGVLYVSEKSEGRIQAFREEKSISHFLSEGPTARFFEGSEFKVNAHYQNWVRDCNKFNSLESQFTDHGFHCGQIEFPETLVVLPSRNILVSDRINGELIEFSPDLDFVKRYFAGREEMGAIGSVAVHAGTLWVSIEGKTSRVIEILNDAETTHDLGQVRIQHFTISKDILYVADFWNGQVSSFWCQAPKEN